MAKDTLTITDNRTGKTYEVPIEKGTVKAMDLRQDQEPDRRLRPHDVRPGLHQHRRPARAAITFIDGDKGILNYRGYPIEQLAEHSTYLEAAYLLLNGELPTQAAARRAGSTTSRTTRWCTRTSRTCWTGSATTRTPWAC